MEKANKANPISDIESDYENLLKSETDGIIAGIKQLDSGGGIPHEAEMLKIRKKFIAN